MRLSILLLFLSSSAVFSQTAMLRGTVKSTSSESLPLVSVSLKNTKWAVLSDSLGRYIFSNIPQGEYILVVNHVGYQANEKKILVNKSLVEENILLASSTKDLQEVVVKAEAVSEVQESKPITIKSIDIKNVVSQNVLLSDVIDRVSGVRIRRSSSLGEKSDISINGIRGEAIRVYIDGIPMEFMYPNFDISTLPIGNVKRLDIYKGVLPVDVGTDAMGGGINIITDQKSHNSLRASYTVGSFNTHLADINVGVANRKNFYANLSGAYNYSDNSYGMKALVFEKNKVETVHRFHDAFRFFYGGLTVGAHSKPWADDIRLTVNYSTGYKELQNGARITHIAFGQAKYDAENLSAVLKYDKSFLNEKVKFSTVGNFSDQTLIYTDTTRNVYSWSGAIIGKKAPGEYTTEQYSDYYTRSLVNRSSLSVELTPNHKLLFSNLYAQQRLTGIDHLEENTAKDYLRIPQYLAKNVAGLQYEGIFYKNLIFSTALKRFDYVLDGAENNTFVLIKKRGGIWGWNAGLKYDFSQHLSVRTSYEKGYLIPQFYQFVGNGGDILRNTDLVPESSDNLNVGFSYADKTERLWTVTTSVNGFYRRQNDIIFIGNGLTKRYENADQVRTLGVEGEASVRYNKSLSLSTNITFLRKTFTELKDPQNQYLLGSNFPNNPNFFGNLELAWQKSNLGFKNSFFRTYLFYNYVAPFNHILVGKTNSYKKTPDAYVPVQHRVGVGCSYRFSKQHLTASLNAVNVLNARLYDNFLVPRAGINFNAKIIYELTQF